MITLEELMAAPKKAGKASKKAAKVAPTARPVKSPVPVGGYVPGVPSSEKPSLAEPVRARSPLPPKPDQAEPAAVSPTGSPTGAPPASRAQSGDYLTTSQGLRLPDTDHSLKAGSRGPTLLQDHHLREKITHFDHERIPERVVHARGAGAHGVFTSYGTAAALTRAGFLAAGVVTPVFVRFSTVLGSRGSADTARDTRGFATKFYTDEGTFDLVGNNIPVFFIQDGIKFPDVIHAAKPHPDREIPQAQSAHDTFWDFVSLHTEATHHTFWNMSDRGIPRSYRTMEGFGVHTFRLENAAGETVLVKFHWKPKAGVHSLMWEEAQVIAGTDPDFHRRDLADAIETGAFPQWELGIQVLPDTDGQTFDGIDLLDATKLVPEELAPVQPIGLMTLNANPTNYFAETEQVAFHVGNLVPGVDITDDPLLHARLFSYIDTQLSRLGGPNFGQLPINRPHAPVNDMLRDGMHQTAVHGGAAPYRPNSLDGGCPFIAGQDLGAFVEIPRPVAGPKVRAQPASFDDHTSQARMFYLSLTDVEQAHLIEAFTFELAKVFETTIRERELLVLANVDAGLCAAVATGLGLPAPKATLPLADVSPSPALSQLGNSWPVTGRVIGVLADESSNLATVAALREAISAAGMLPLIVAPHAGFLGKGAKALGIQRTMLTCRSTEFDAIIDAAVHPDAAPKTGKGPVKAPPVPMPLAADPRTPFLLAEAFRHAKALGGLTGTEDAFAAAGIDVSAPGIVIVSDPAELVAGITALLATHRVWDRFPVTA
jgi:catalase